VGTAFGAPVNLGKAQRLVRRGLQTSRYMDTSARRAGCSASKALAVIEHERRKGRRLKKISSRSVNEIIKGVRLDKLRQSLAIPSLITNQLTLAILIRHKCDK